MSNQTIEDDPSLPDQAVGTPHVLYALLIPFVLLVIGFAVWFVAYLRRRGWQLRWGHDLIASAELTPLERPLSEREHAEALAANRNARIPLDPSNAFSVSDDVDLDLDLDAELYTDPPRSLRAEEPKKD